MSGSAVKSRASVKTNLYLGFTIREVDGAYIATPDGWHGPMLADVSEAKLRTRIWHWWNQV